MPTISVTKNEIELLLNTTYTPQNFSNLLFDFGLEIDDIVESHEEISYKIEIPANRYDLLCAEGLSNALRSYINGIVYEDYILRKSNYKIIKKSNYRGCIASAVIKNIKFTKESYKSFIAYQEKLSDSLGKNRSIVSIGTHNLDKIEFPVTFANIYKSYNDKFITDSENDKNIKCEKNENKMFFDKLNFKPLNSTIETSDLYDYFKDDKKMLKYLSYTENDKYTVFMDNKNEILSLPPVINSDLTKITLDTTNVFVEITGTNQHKVDVCLKMILSAFKTDEMYEVSIIDAENNLKDVIDKENKIKEDLSEEINDDINNDDSSVDNKKKDFYSMEITCQEVFNELNIKLNISELSTLLIKMMYKTEILSESKLKIIIPLVRQDVLHKCDIIEDIAISYGYNNIKKILPDVNTIGKENELNKFSDKIRLEMAILGFIEVYTLILVSRTDNGDNGCQKEKDLDEKMDYKSSKEPKNDNGKILVDNYKSSECEEVRSTLIDGLLKSVASNLHCKIPIKIFEVGDVVYLDKNNDVGASNKRKLACLCVGNKSHLEDIQGPLTLLLNKCGITDFSFEHKDDTTKYLKNQSAVIKIGNEICGSIGVCSGKLLNKYRIPHAGSMFEIDLEKVFSFKNK